MIRKMGAPAHPTKVTRRFASSVPTRIRDEGIYEDNSSAKTPTPRGERYRTVKGIAVPEWAALPAETQLELFERPRPSAAIFRQRFQELGGDPLLMLPAGRLFAVAQIFCEESTSRADWVWLLDTLNAAKEASPNWDEVPVAEPVFRVLRGMALAMSEDYDKARANVAIGLALAMESSPSKSFFPEYPLFVLGHYVRLCSSKGRIDDVAVAVRYAGTKLQKLLIHVSDNFPLGPSAERLRELLHGALNEIRDPAKWLEGQFNVRGRDGGLSRANYLLGDALFAALVFDRSRTADAFNLWIAMRKRFAWTSLMPPVASLLGRNLAQNDQMAAARQIFGALHRKHSNLPHSALSNELWAYARKGMIEEAHEVWEQLIAGHRPTPKDRLAYANAYASRGDVEGTTTTLSSLFGPQYLEQIDCLDVLVRASISANDSDGAQHYLDLAREVSATPPTAMYEALLHLHAKQANVDDAVKMFESLMALEGASPSKKAYTSLISVFANKADYANATLVFEAMQAAGHEPDAVSWSALLNASIEAGEWRLAAEQCTKIAPELLQDFVLATTVLKAYVLVRAPNNVIMTLFRRIKNPGPRAWSLAILAATDDSNQVLARNLFDEMDAQVTKDPLAPAPDVYIFSTLLAMYLRAGDRNSARAVYDTMVFREVVPTSVTYGIITTSYANSAGESSVEQAHNFAMSVYNRVIANELPHARGEASENVFGPLLIASGRNKDMERAQKYYNLVQSTGRDSRTLNHKLLEAYRRSGQLKPLYRLWLRLFQNAVATVPQLPADGDTPSRMHNNVLCIPLSITLKAFAEAGMHDRLKKLWMSVRTAGFGFDAQNYDHMAKALAMTGDVMGAFHIVDRVLIPRYDEVTNRYRKASREHKTVLPVDLKTTPADLDIMEANMADAEVDLRAAAVDPTAPTDDFSTDDVAERGPRVSNRRHQIALPKRDVSEDEQQYGSEVVAESETAPAPEPQVEQRSEFDKELDILRSWRPADVLWRPSDDTMFILTQAYDQLERQSNTKRTWGLGMSLGDEGDAEGDEDFDAPILRLPDFNNVTVKNDDGTPRRTSPKVLLVRIHRRYVRAMMLVDFYRRKNSSR
jgi:pentatricopeptide repeat protein